jgi:peroxiredoxin
MTKVNVGDVLNLRELTTIHGNPVQVPGSQRLVHLQFRRYSGCPICNLHLRSITRRYDEILAAGIGEVVVFHSSAETMLKFQGELQFPTIADPERELYTEFGVESSPKAVLHPRALLAATRAMTRQHNLRTRPLRPSPAGATGMGENHLGLPADFLIAPDGRVVAAKYGKHADDQWSVDELLNLASSQ